MSDPYIAICAKCKWAKLAVGESRSDDTAWLCKKHEHIRAINCVTGEEEFQVMVPARDIALRRQFGPMADLINVPEGMEAILPTGFRMVKAAPGLAYEFCKNINRKGDCPDYEEVTDGSAD